MIDRVLALYKQFKDRKKEDDIVMGAGDRELTGALAIADAINKLADTLAEFRPILAAAVDAYLNQEEYVLDEDTFEMSTDNLARMKELIEKALIEKAQSAEEDDTYREELQSEKGVFADPIDGPSDPSSSE